MEEESSPHSNLLVSAFEDAGVTSSVDEMRLALRQLSADTQMEEDVLNEFDEILSHQDVHVLPSVRMLFSRVLTESVREKLDDSTRHVVEEILGVFPVGNGEEEVEDNCSDLSIDRPLSNSLLKKNEVEIDSSVVGQMKRFFYRYLPIVSLLQRYQKDWFMRDLVAGITIGVFVIPQGVAYSLVAELPPIHGLYSCVFPALVYALFGSSGQLSVAPVALLSLLTAEATSSAASLDERISLASTLALLSGLIQGVMGVLGFGFIVNFLSHSVISGFTAGAAVVIMTSQFKHVFGTSPKSGTYWWQSIYNILAELPSTKGYTFLFAAITFVIAMFLKFLPRYLDKNSFLKKFLKVFPHSLIVVVLGTIISYAADLEKQVKLSVVGQIPGGLPAPSWPSTPWSEYGSLAIPAFTIAIISFAEGFAIAKKFAFKHGDEINANGELLGCGLGNVIGSVFQGYPVAGGFSRTAVNEEVGAKTVLAGLITAIVAALFLLLFLGVQLLYHLPKSVLGVVIIMAVSGLIDIEDMKKTFRTSKRDFMLVMIGIVATLGLGIEFGLALAVVLSIVFVVQHVSKPHYAVLGRLPHTNVFRNIKRFPDAIQEPGILVLRYDSSLFFANIEHFKDRVRKQISRSENRLFVVVLDFSSVNSLDMSSVHGLHEIIEELERDEIVSYFAAIKGPVRDMIALSELDHCIPTEHRFLTLPDAVCAARKCVHKRISHAEQALSLPEERPTDLDAVHIDVENPLPDSVQ